MRHAVEVAEVVAQLDAVAHDQWRADPRAVLDATVVGLGGEPRAGQQELTAAVADAIRHGHHLLAEAPTGSGKSLAYLAPAIASGLRVVVATSTIALQSQLIDKDLPSLVQHGGVPFTFALLKGRANYVCLSKLRAAGAADALFEVPVGSDFASHLATIREFADESTNGDRAQLPDAIPNPSWAAVSCTSTECPGRAECRDGDDCFYELAKENARDMSVLVVNHALYCAHLAAGSLVLPEHDLVIIDEAHAFADNATNAFGEDLSYEGLRALTSMLTKARAGKEPVEAFSRAAAQLSVLVDDREGTIETGDDAKFVDAATAAAESLARAYDKLDRDNGDEYVKRTGRLAHKRLSVLRRLADPDDGDVVWVERVGRSGRRVRVAPVVAGPAIGRMLLDRTPVIAVSATLGGEPPFRALAHQMGFDPEAECGAWAREDKQLVARPRRGYRALETPSSFDWRTQGLLYVASDLPEPRRGNDAWTERAGERICKLVEAAGGRALVLCTSHKNVDAFGALLRANTEHEILVQGDADTGRLTRSFIADETSVLVGTRSFWAGIDAPGIACVLVVIDKLPFPAPDEPLHAARRRRAEEAGLNPFIAVDVPVAALVLAQGTGRLLRRTTDLGVVAVLDPRLATRDYRKALLAALPPYRRSVSLDEACAFLEEAAASLPKAAPVELPPDEIVEHADGDVRDDLSITKTRQYRDAVMCPACWAEAGDRCHTATNGILAFVHHARVIEATRE